MTDTVSIITPVFNSDKYLSETILSVISQTHQNWELIIVNDASKDKSLEIINFFLMRDNRIKLINLKSNVGVAAARNIAMDKAKGRFIAFLDSDDIWAPEKIEKQLVFMNTNAIDFSFTAYEKINEHGKKIGIMNVPAKVTYEELLKTCVIGCLTVVYDTKSLGKIYMPINTKREDFSTWLNILKITKYSFGLNEVLAFYRVYSQQGSANKIKMARENWKLYREIEKLNIIKSIYYFSNYAVRGYLRTKYPKVARLFKLL